MLLAAHAMQASIEVNQTRGERKVLGRGGWHREQVDIAEHDSVMGRTEHRNRAAAFRIAGKNRLGVANHEYVTEAGSSCRQEAEWVLVELLNVCSAWNRMREQTHGRELCLEPGVSRPETEASTV
jgi:hypothetical protein